MIEQIDTIEQDLDGDEERIDDESEKEDKASTIYSITSYGADYTVEVILSKLDKSIMIPSFQRGYVWNIIEASRFIESLLLGLPVPGIFLSKSDKSNLLIIDGQQRIRSLQFFFNGIITEGPSKGKAFILKNVDERFNNRSYNELDPDHRIELNDSLIHATIIKQDEPSNDQSSIFQIFERLNTGGRRLYPQEIRSCIYHGAFNELLAELNTHAQWRDIAGKENPRQKDRELILRFFSLLRSKKQYTAPMKEFLNHYMSKNRNLTADSGVFLRETFSSTIDVIYKSIGLSAFKPEGILNAAVFDSVMYGVAKRLEKGNITDQSTLSSRYSELFQNNEFKKAYRTGTSHKESVKARLSISQKNFEDIE